MVVGLAFCVNNFERTCFGIKVNNQLNGSVVVWRILVCVIWEMELGMVQGFWRSFKY